jgi:ComF family protein
VDSFIRKKESFVNWILEILYPSVCLGCQLKGEILCIDCISKITRNEKELSPNIDAIFYYHDPFIKKIIWSLKYHNHPYLGQKLGKILYDEYKEDLSNIEIYTKGEPILVIPVPITKKKTKIRGYNQAEKIALGFCLSGENKVFNFENKIIKKIIETIPQARIDNRKRRLENIRGAFIIEKPEMVKGRTVLVIDDVTTTGGTLNEIINILKKAGAKKVLGLAIAH